MGYVCRGVYCFGNDHFEGALPTGPVLGNRTVHGKLFVDDFVPVHFNRMFDQSHLCECTEGAHGVEALIDGGRSTCTFDDYVSTVAGDRADKFGYILARDIYGVFCVFSHSKAMGVAVCSADNNTSASESGEVGAHQANGTGTGDEYPVAGYDFCVKKNGFDAAGEGFNERGSVIGDGFGKRKGEVLGDDAVFGKPAVAHAANGFALRAKEKFAGSTMATVPTCPVRCGKDRDAVACFDAGDIGADFDDFARKFMAKRDRWMNAITAVADVEISAAESAALNGDFNVVGVFDIRFWNVA